MYIMAKYNNSNKNDAISIYKLFVRYLIKYRLILLVLIIAVGIVNILNSFLKYNCGIYLDTIYNVSLSIITGVVASIMMQSITDFHYNKDIAFYIQNDTKEIYKDLVLPGHDTYKEKVEFINNFHNKICDLNNKIQGHYSKHNIWDSSLELDIFNFLLAIEKETSININIEDKYNSIDRIKITKIYYSLFKLLNSNEFSTILTILTNCIISCDLTNELDRCKISEDELDRVQEFMNKEIKTYWSEKDNRELAYRLLHKYRSLVYAELDKFIIIEREYDIITKSKLASIIALVIIEASIQLGFINYETITYTGDTERLLEFDFIQNRIRELISEEKLDIQRLIK